MFPNGVQVILAHVKQVEEGMETDPAVGVEESSRPAFLPLRRLLRLRQRCLCLVDATADDAKQDEVLLSRLHVLHIEPRNRDLDPLLL